MVLSFYDFCWLFFFYGFLGWCSEVGFAAIDEGRFVNRGFLNGPICPIYGVGVILIILVLTALSQHILLLFFGSMILATALEYLTGWFMEKMFHAKWWDYTDYPLNIKGYICLEFSILWGFSATFVVKLVHPAIVHLIHVTPPVLGMFLLLVAFSLMLIDLIVTVASIRNLQQHLRVLSAVANEMHGVSDRMGDAISGTVLSTRQKVTQKIDRYDAYIQLYTQHRAEEKALVESNRAQERDLVETHRAEEQAVLARIRAEIREAKHAPPPVQTACPDTVPVMHGSRSIIRLIRAFPTLRIPQYQDLLDSVRDLPAGLVRQRRDPSSKADSEPPTSQ